MTITPSEHQVAAIKSVSEWYKSGQKPFFYLAGYAGTGKTSIIKETVSACGLDPDDMRDVRYGSYTGKAALVLRRKGMRAASTIHRLIYMAVEDPDTGQVRFELNPNSPIQDIRLVVLDECSMIDDQMATDLMSFGIKILVVGDPGQLPPINGEGMFTRGRPDYFLTEIHRQAADNPIIRFATMAREGLEIPWGSWDDRFRCIEQSAVTLDDLTGADQIITGKNLTRRVLNNNLKVHYGYHDVLPIKPGIKLICLRNQHQLGLLNGMMFRTLDDNCYISKSKKFFVQSLHDDADDCTFPELEIYQGHFTDYVKERTEAERRADYKVMRKYSQFDLGYAITAHKSAGSQWENVILWDDGFGKWDKDLRAKWLYSSITRAEERMIIAR